MVFAKSFLCPSCGRVHQADIGTVLIEPGALERIPAVLAQVQRSDGQKIQPSDRLLLVMDEHTRQAAGTRVARILNQAGYADCQCLVYPGQGQLVADEAALGRFYHHLDRQTALIVAVGSGTINDLSRYVSFKFGIPYVIVATAPSMDGYASSVSPLIVDNLKTTFEAVCAAAIIADTEVMAKAPAAMIAAGFADILGKYNALCDWQISHIVTGEYYCDTIADMVRNSLKTCVAHSAGIAARETQAIAALCEALILTGVAMAYAGNSRPASSAEHHLAHFWEMRFLFEGKQPVLHGTKVGIATLATAYLHRRLAEQPQVDFDAALQALESYDAGEWEKTMRRVYGPGAPGVIATERAAGKNDVGAAKARIRRIRDHWDELMSIQKKAFPDIAVLERLLLQTGGPIHPQQVGLTAEEVYDSLRYAKEIRPRYSLLQLLWDLNLLAPYAKAACRYYAAGQREKPAYQSAAFARSRLDQAACYVLDMDGTFYLGDRLLPGAREFLDIVRQSGKRFLFYTNNSSKNKQAYLDKLHKLGVDIGPDQLLIANQVIIDEICAKHPGKSVFILGTPLLKAEFAAAGIPVVEDNPDLVVVGFDTTLAYPALSKACAYIRQGVPCYGINPDFNCPVEGGFIPDCGSIWALITASTGIVPTYFGKPSKATLDYICRYTGLPPEALVFVGDRMYTDIAIGREGPVTTVLVLTGEAGEMDAYTAPVRPTLVFDSIQELGAFISDGEEKAADDAPR